MISSRSKGYYLKIYLWALAYLNRYRGHFIALVLCGIVMSGIGLAIPKFIQRLIDVIIPSKDQIAFVWLIISFVLLIIALFAVTVLRQWLQRNIQEKAGRDLQFSLFSHLRKLGFSYYERTPVGYTLSMFHTEADAIQQIYRNFFPSLLEKGITLLITSFLLISINAQMSLIIIPCFLIYFTAGPYFSKKWGLWNKEALNLRRETGKKLYDSISALLEVRAHGREQWDLKRLIDSQSEYHHALLKQYLFSYLRGAMQVLSMNAGALVLFVIGAVLVRHGSLSIGEFVAFSLYYFMVMRDLVSLVYLITQQSVVLSHAERLYTFLGEEPDVKEPVKPVILPNINGELHLDNITFGYPNQPDVIKDFKLHIRPGEKVAFVGSSGHGKSTLLKLICRFYDPQKGEIRLDGVPLPQISLSQIRRSIGYVFQETYLFGGNIIDNIRFGNPDATEDEIIAAAKSAFAHDFIMEFPQGYETEVGERGVKLSGGQKQRIAIARMFVKNPSIVLLDEATSALDNLSEREVQIALDALLEGRTTIAVAHRLSTVQHYDRLILVEQGKPAESGRYEDLINKRGMFYHLVIGQQSAEGASL
ncbi:ABC transporter ATP-binding protein [Paenibacillus alkalitolerans]|uniref:ABC transporter ATP-binding protein n=1 Tax=Paenibacillus alkalitolerans TaxID=2799335 RepID=UPI002279561C|nr:ABC transporter ATP-binding protein [Paenibacillus alkalitolerans]